VSMFTGVGAGSHFGGEQSELEQLASRHRPAPRSDVARLAQDLNTEVGLSVQVEAVDP
jgi:hypothetical protein